MKKTAALVAAVAAMMFAAPALAQQPTPPPAREQSAPDVATAHIIVLHATNDGKGIDPSIGKLPQLKQPPFSSYDSYKLLAKKNLGLKVDEVAEASLPGDSKLKLKLLDRFFLQLTGCHVALRRHTLGALPKLACIKCQPCNTSL